MSSSLGPLGHLPGYSYDPIRKRYFPGSPPTTKTKGKGARGGERLVGGSSSASGSSSRGQKEKQRDDLEGRGESKSKRTGREEKKGPKGGGSRLIGEQSDAVESSTGASSSSRKDPFRLPTSPRSAPPHRHPIASLFRYRRHLTSSSYSNLPNQQLEPSQPFPSNLTKICSVPSTVRGSESGSIVGDRKGGLFAVKYETVLRDGTRGELGTRRCIWQEISLGSEVSN